MLLLVLSTQEALVMDQEFISAVISSGGILLLSKSSGRMPDSLFQRALSG